MAPQQRLGSQTRGAIHVAERIGHLFRCSKALLDSLAEETCSLDEPEGCAQLAWHFDRGIAVKEDPARAHVLWSEACKRGVARACANLGWQHDVGRAVAKSPFEAMTYFAGACELGDPEACAALALGRLEGHGIAPNGTLGVQLADAACEAGSARGCDRLGWAISFGAGVEADQTLGATLWKRACELDPGSDCTNYAVALEREGKLEQAQAKHLLACNDGSDLGCANLARLFARDCSNVADRILARKLAEQGCRPYHPASCKLLVWMLEAGVGGKRDPVRAAALKPTVALEQEVIRNLGWPHALR